MKKAINKKPNSRRRKKAVSKECATCFNTGIAVVESGAQHLCICPVGETVREKIC